MVVRRDEYLSSVECKTTITSIERGSWSHESAIGYTWPDHVCPTGVRCGSLLKEPSCSLLGQLKRQTCSPGMTGKKKKRERDNPNPVEESN